MATYGLDLLPQFCLESAILRPVSRLWRPRKLGAPGQLRDFGGNSGISLR